MKKNLFLVLIMAAIGIMPSCKKDPVQTKVVFGNSQGMTVTSYEGVPLVEQYGHFSWGYYIDLNGDRQNDVQFRSYTGGPGGLQGVITELNCFNENVAFLGDIIDQEFLLLANNANDSFGLYNSFKNTNVTLDPFPMGEMKYIGFKLTENSKSRLGWMKIILHKDYAELLETAIQQ